jgi:O-succinylbenzoate synthase
MCNLKSESLTIRISKRRKLKLQQYAAQKDKTITALIEEWIDLLKLKEDTNIRWAKAHKSLSSPGWKPGVLSF